MKLVAGDPPQVRRPVVLDPGYGRRIHSVTFCHDTMQFCRVLHGEQDFVAELSRTPVSPDRVCGVLKLGPLADMTHVAARRVVARMKSAGFSPAAVLKKKGDSMCPDGPGCVEPNRSVSLGSSRSGPFPTVVRLTLGDMAPKPDIQRCLPVAQRVTGETPAFVMPITVTTSLVSVDAAFNGSPLQLTHNSNDTPGGASYPSHQLPWLWETGHSR